MRAIFYISQVIANISQSDGAATALAMAPKHASWLGFLLPRFVFGAFWALLSEPKNHIPCLQAASYNSKEVRTASV